MLAFTGIDRRRKAADLIEMWGRLSSQHLAGGQGCGCSFGGLMFMASDFELDIVEFVIGEAGKAGLPEVEPIIDAIAKRGPDRYSLPALLKALEQGEIPPGAEREADFIVERLDTTLSNMEQAHSKGRFACD